MDLMDENELFARLDRSLTNITPSSEQIARIEAVREMAKAYAHQLWDCCPSTAERTLATRKLEESVMWAVKSIVLEPSDARE